MRSGARLGPGLTVGAGVVLRAAAAFAFTKACAAWLGPEGFARYGHLAMLAAYLLTASSGGLGNALTVYLGRREATGGGAPAGTSDASAVLVIGAATGGVAAIGLAILVASGLAEGYLPRLGLDQLPAWMAFCLAVGLGAAHLAVELAAQRHRRYQATAAAIPLLALAVLGALAAAGRLDAERAILAFMAGWLVPVAALVWRGPSPLRATREAIRQAVVFARPYLLPSLLAPTVGTLGVLAVRQAVAGSASPHDLGLWQALWRVAEAVMGLLASILSALLIPRLSRLTTRAEAGRAIQRACLAGVLLYLPVALAWLVVPRLALRLLLAPAFLGVEALLPLQVVGDLLKVVATVLVLACTALLRPGLTLLAEVVFSAAFAGLALLLTPGGGPLGAVGAYVGAYAVLLAVLLPLVVRLVRSLPVAAPS